MIKIVSNTVRLEYKCAPEGCNWRVNCFPIFDNTTYRCISGQLEHNCKPTGLYNHVVNARWVAPRIMGYVSDHINCKPSTIQSRMKRKHKVQISYWTVWHARHICLEKFFGSFLKKVIGLIDGVARQFGHVRHYHRFCFTHMYKNMKIKFPGAYLEELVWRAAKNYNEIDYKFWMDQVEELNPDARIWLVVCHVFMQCLSFLQQERMSTCLWIHAIFFNKYMKTYVGSVEPIANLVYWLEVPDIYKINPPRIVNPVGRLISQRRREINEQLGLKRAMKQCGICKDFGIIGLVAHFNLRVIHLMLVSIYIMDHMLGGLLSVMELE